MGGVAARWHVSLLGTDNPTGKRPAEKNAHCAHKTPTAHPTLHLLTRWSVRVKPSTHPRSTTHPLIQGAEAQDVLVAVLDGRQRRGFGLFGRRGRRGGQAGWGRGAPAGDRTDGKAAGGLPARAQGGRGGVHVWRVSGGNRAWPKKRVRIVAFPHFRLSKEKGEIDLLLSVLVARFPFLLARPRSFIWCKLGHFFM
jgi:hypothetical protein